MSTAGSRGERHSAHCCFSYNLPTPSRLRLSNTPQKCKSVTLTRALSPSETRLMSFPCCLLTPACSTPDSERTQHSSTEQQQSQLDNVFRFFRFCPFPLCVLNSVYERAAWRCNLVSSYLLSYYLSIQPLKQKLERWDGVSFPILCFRVSPYLGFTCHGPRTGHQTVFSKHCHSFWLPLGQGV